MAKRALAWSVGAALIALPLSSLQAASERDELKAVESSLEETKKKAKALEGQSEKVTGELNAIQKDMVFIAEKMQGAETRLSELEAELTQLTAQEAEKRTTLEERRTEMAKSLSAMARLSRIPPEAVIAMPGDFQKTMLASRALQGVVDGLKHQAEMLQVEILEIQNIQSTIAARKDSLAQEKQTLEEQKRGLDEKMAERTKIQKQILTDLKKHQADILALSKKSASLRELIAQLEEKRTQMAARSEPRDATREKPEPRPVEAVFTGRFRPPVSGSVVAKFGDPAEAGSTSKGIRIITRENAQVIAPYGGEVVFTGPFLGYGKILIIRHEEGYHTLLSGLKRIDTVPGQKLLAGEPVGVMGDGKEKLTQLYMELRRNNKPIDPMRWVPAKNKG